MFSTPLAKNVPEGRTPLKPKGTYQPRKFTFMHDE